MEQRDISILNEDVFTWVFGEKDGLPILQVMLNSFFDYAGTTAVSGLELQESRLGPQALGEKGSRLDILAKDESGRLIEIEVQTRSQEYFFERSLFYWSRLYSRQLGRGRKYRELHPVICVNILDFSLDDRPEWYTREITSRSDHFQIHTIELPKLRKAPLINAEIWATFLETEGRQHEIAARLCAEHEELKAAERRFEEFMAVDARFFRALVKEKNERDLIGQMDYARKMGRKEGFEQGLEQGKELGRRLSQEQGLERGKELGLEQGKIESKHEIARALKAQDIDISVISKATGLNKAEIESL